MKLKKLISRAFNLILLCLAPLLLDAQIKSNQSILLEYVAGSQDNIAFIKAQQAPLALVLLNGEQGAYGELRHLLVSNGIRLTTDYDAGNTLHVDFVIKNSFIKRGRSGGERILEGTVILTIESPSGEILASKRSDIAYKDNPSVSAPSELESVWENSRFHQVTSAGRFGKVRRYLEPVMIIGAVGTTVYLLYNIRSQ